MRTLLGMFNDKYSHEFCMQDPQLYYVDLLNCLEARLTVPNVEIIFLICNSATDVNWDVILSNLQFFDEYSRCVGH